MTKKKWEDFEVQCHNWLNTNFGDLARFDLMGGSNSSVSDIKVTLPNNVQFFIEVKAAVSQCSQFVLFPDKENKVFDYSLKNKLEMNPFTQHIIDYMNDHFEDFCNPSSSGILLDPNASEAAGHIRYQHMVKGVEFFLSKNNIDFILIPLSFIGFYFDIEAVYRKKKSGSRNIPIKDRENLNNWLENKYHLKCEQKGDEFVTKKRDDLIDEKLSIDDSEYMFKESESEYMRLRSLSSTNNPNVIFTISLKNDIEGLPNEYFRSLLVMLSR